MSDDNLFEDDDGDDEANAIADGLMKAVLDYVEANDVASAFAADTLISIAISLRTAHYFEEAEKPSAQGLKLDLDRFQRDIGDFVREAKRHADETIASFRTAAESAGEPDAS